MTVHSLYPSFVQIHYRSAFGKHVQTIQTRQWDGAIGTHGYGGFNKWVGGTIEADTMINDLLSVITPFASDGVTWDEAIIFNYPAVPPALPNPVAVIPLTAVGAIAAVPAAEALQMTLNFFDSGFNPVKLVLLDIDCTGSFTPQDYAALPGTKQDLVDYYTGTGHAFASRADLKPTVFRQAVWKYNDKLRKEYHLN
jgi:hypothetical protein